MASGQLSLAWIASYPIFHQALLQHSLRRVCTAFATATVQVVQYLTLFSLGSLSSWDAVYRDSTEFISHVLLDLMVPAKTTVRHCT